MGCIKMLRKALIWCKNALYKSQAWVKPAGEPSLFHLMPACPLPPLAVHPPSAPSRGCRGDENPSPRVAGDGDPAQDSGLHRARAAG